MWDTLKTEGAVESNSVDTVVGGKAEGGLG